MATDTVRPAAVTVTEHCLGLVERLRLTLEMTERFNKQLNDARDAIEQAKRLPAIAGRRNGKAVESSVRRNLNVASQACAGWRNSFDNTANNLVAWSHEFDAVVSSMSTGDRRQIAAVLSRKQPPALAILGFSPYYWEAEVSRELAEHVVGAMRRFFDCDDNAKLFPLGDEFYDIETAVDIRDMLIRDLFDTLGTKSELDLLESELARDLAELRLIVDDRGAASIGIEITPVLRDLERVSESEPAEVAGQVAGGVPADSPEQQAEAAANPGEVAHGNKKTPKRGRVIQGENADFVQWVGSKWDSNLDITANCRVFAAKQAVSPEERERLSMKFRRVYYDNFGPNS